jgi:hypothetical protein
MSLFSQLHLLPRPFWVLVGATFVNRFGVFVVPFLALFITRNGNSAAQAGLAVAAYSLGGFARRLDRRLDGRPAGSEHHHGRVVARRSALCMLCHVAGG